MDNVCDRSQHGLPKISGISGMVMFTGPPTWEPQGPGLRGREQSWPTGKKLGQRAGASDSSSSCPSYVLQSKTRGCQVVCSTACTGAPSKHCRSGDKIIMEGRKLYRKMTKGLFLYCRYTLNLIFEGPSHVSMTFQRLLGLFTSFHHGLSGCLLTRSIQNFMNSPLILSLLAITPRSRINA